MATQILYGRRNGKDISFADFDETTVAMPVSPP